MKVYEVPLTLACLAEHYSDIKIFASYIDYQLYYVNNVVISFLFVSYETPIIKENFPKYSFESHKILPQNAVLYISLDNVCTINVNVNGDMH